MSGQFKPVILPSQGASDDEIIAASNRSLLGGSDDSPLVVMELLQRLRVKDVMKKSEEIISCSRAETMRDAQMKMKKNRISGLPVAENGRLFGIVSMNDIIGALEGGWINEPCGRHMATSLVVLESDMPLAFALKFFQNYTFARFPVLDKDRRLVGLISQRDVTRALLVELSRELDRLEKKNSAEDRRVGEDGLPYYEMRQFVVVRNDLSNAGKASAAIKQMLKDHKVDSRITRRVAVAAYELEINICIHSVGGTLTFILSKDGAMIVAKDSGPGIEDVEWACRDGTSTANDWIRSLGFGAGMGLANSKRVSDEFDIKSVMGKGTTVTCNFKFGPGASATPSAPAAGE